MTTLRVPSAPRSEQRLHDAKISCLGAISELGNVGKIPVKKLIPLDQDHASRVYLPTCTASAYVVTKLRRFDSPLT